MGAGFLANAGNNSNKVVLFLSWISPLHYSCEMLFRRILDGYKLPLNYNTQDLLNYFGYIYGDKMCLWILFIFWIGFTLIGWIVLLIRGKD